MLDGAQSCLLDLTQRPVQLKEVVQQAHLGVHVQFSSIRLSFLVPKFQRRVSYT